MARVIKPKLICRGSRCGGDPRVPLSGTHLCAGCTQALARDLGALPQLYEQCGRLLGGGDRAPTAERTGGGPLPGLPFNESAADARAAIVTLTASWSGLVAEQRRVTPPPRTVPDLAQFLLRHLSWLLAHPAAAEFGREIGETADAARRVVDLNSLRRIRVGSCVEQGCAGSLAALVRTGGTMLSAEVVCSAEPAHRWAAQEWAQLGRRLSQAGPGTARWLGATDIAQLWGISTGSVYRMASERGWTRVSRDGRVYYSADDVHASFAARAVPAGDR
jgi:hypothetical protein